MKKVEEYNYDFDYVVPLEVLHKNYVKANKEYNKKLEEKRKQEDFNRGLEVIIMLFVMTFSIAMALLSYFVK